MFFPWMLLGIFNLCTDSSATLHCTPTALILFCHGGAIVSSGAHFAAYPFNITEDAHQILTENLMNVGGTVPAIEQCLRDLRQVGGRIYSLRGGAAHAIEVRAQSHMVDASNFRDVIDVIDERTERRPRDFRHPLALDAVNLHIVDRLALGLLVVDEFLNRRRLVFRLGFQGFTETLVIKSVEEV